MKQLNETARKVLKQLISEILVNETTYEQQKVYVIRVRHSSGDMLIKPHKFGVKTSQFDPSRDVTDVVYLTKKEALSTAEKYTNNTGTATEVYEAYVYVSAQYKMNTMGKKIKENYLTI